MNRLFEIPAGVVMGTPQADSRNLETKPIGALLYVRVACD